MAGHSKWTQIKRQKAVEDAKRAGLFSQLSRQITQAAKETAGDRDQPAVKRAIAEARAANMPAANIERAITQAGGDAAGDWPAIRYEAYGPGGAALIIEGAAESPNRLTQAVKHLLAQHGGQLAKPGTALWAFQKTASGWTANHQMLLPPNDHLIMAQLLSSLRDHPNIKVVATNAQGL